MTICRDIMGVEIRPGDLLAFPYERSAASLIGVMHVRQIRPIHRGDETEDMSFSVGGTLVAHPDSLPPYECENDPTMTIWSAADDCIIIQVEGKWRMPSMNRFSESDDADDPDDYPYRG